jgi:2-polyprenyl-6-methoxyphenol hydroxylase-like FAD-dependent oxidoreductase
VRPLPASLSRGRVVLVGDAAHAVAPTLNQGANLALEDGVALGRAFGHGAGMAEGLARFDAARLARCRRASARSRRMLGIGAGWAGPGAVRDALVHAGGRWLPVTLAGGA